MHFHNIAGGITMVNEVSGVIRSFVDRVAEVVA